MLSDVTPEMAWVETGDGSAIEYARDKIEELRQLAVKGFIAFGRGGLEIGGVLYGRRSQDRWIVEGYRELECEHALGPGFMLSDSDRRKMQEILQPPAGLSVLGWFRSHTRRGLDLDAGDRELFQYFSASEPALALILKPQRWGASAGAFYVRRPSGEIVPPEPREFAVEPAQRPTMSIPEVPETREIPIPVLDPTPVVAEAPVMAEAAASTETPPAAEYSDDTVLYAPEPPSERRKRRILVTAMAVAGLLVALVGIMLFTRPARDLSLQVYSIAPAQVRIAWNRNSAPVLGAASGIVEIHDDGEDTKIPLTASQLRSSSITYTQKTPAIQVNLHVEPLQRGGTPYDESVQFVGTADRQPPPVTAEVDVDSDHTAPPPPVATSPAQTQVQPIPAAGQVRDAAKLRRIRDDYPDDRQQKRVEIRPADPPEQPIRKFQPPPPTRVGTPEIAQAILPAAPVEVSSSPGQHPLPDFFPKPQPIARPITPVPTTPATPAKVVPRFGRLIWTGKLTRHELVEIDGSHASVGSLTGYLPGAPGQYRVLPAEFTKEGLEIYTTDGSLHGKTEPPSALNGWNAVLFQFDPVRVKQIQVLEAPNRLNHFSRVVVRSDARTIPAIVVDWSGQ